MQEDYATKMVCLGHKTGEISTEFIYGIAK
jgi:hypothetical protein